LLPSNLNDLHVQYRTFFSRFFADIVFNAAICGSKIRGFISPSLIRTVTRVNQRFLGPHI